MPDYASGAGDLFDAVGSLFGGFAKASGYKKAATLSAENADIAAGVGNVELMRSRWAAFKSFGATRAALAGSGVRSDTGTSLDLLSEAHRNAALDEQLINEQTRINVNTYAAESASYSSQAAAAKGGGIFDAIGKIIGAVATVAGGF